MLQKVHTAKTQ